MAIGFDEYKKMMKEYTDNADITTTSEIDECVFRSDINEISDEDILNDIYKQMGGSFEGIKSFNVEDELWSIIALMKEPDEGTLEYELYSTKIGFLTFLDKYNEDISRIENEFKRRDVNGKP